MNSQVMQEIMVFMTGGILWSNFVAALFFYRFWLRTKDRIFAVFSVAFAVFGLERIALEVVRPLPVETEEALPFVYLMRLSAFIFIILGILDKNRSALDRARGDKAVDQCVDRALG